MRPAPARVVSEGRASCSKATPCCPANGRRDLRRLALVTRASRPLARSPCSAPPRIRFLFVGPQLRFPLPSRRPHGRSAVRFARCDQLTGGLPPPSRCPCRRTKKESRRALGPAAHNGSTIAGGWGG